MPRTGRTFGIGTLMAAPLGALFAFSPLCAASGAPPLNPRLEWLISVDPRARRDGGRGRDLPRRHRGLIRPGRRTIHTRVTAKLLAESGGAPRSRTRPRLVRVGTLAAALIGGVYLLSAVWWVRWENYRPY